VSKLPLSLRTATGPELKNFYKKRVRGGLPPDITFEVDLGDKNRRRLDELSN
jgi:hypothetical protein